VRNTAAPLLFEAARMGVLRSVMTTCYIATYLTVRGMLPEGDPRRIYIEGRCKKTKAVARELGGG
jgi:hypothetical protein